MKLLKNLCVNSNWAFGELNSLVSCIVSAIKAVSFKCTYKHRRKAYTECYYYFLFYTDTINIV